MSSARWMLTINMMVGAVATPIVGRLSGGGRPKRLMMVLLLIIVAGSIIGATPTSFGMLLLGRGMQGVSFGIIPVSIALVRRHETERTMERGIAALAVTAITGADIRSPA